MCSCGWEDAGVTSVCRSFGATGGGSWWGRLLPCSENCPGGPGKELHHPDTRLCPCQGHLKVDSSVLSDSVTHIDERPGPGGQRSKFESCICCVTLSQFLPLSDPPFFYLRGSRSLSGISHFSPSGIPGTECGGQPWRLPEGGPSDLHPAPCPQH